MLFGKICTQVWPIFKQEYEHDADSKNQLLGSEWSEERGRISERLWLLPFGFPLDWIINLRSSNNFGGMAASNLHPGRLESSVNPRKYRRYNGEAQNILACAMHTVLVIPC